MYMHVSIYIYIGEGEMCVWLGVRVPSVLSRPVASSPRSDCQRRAPEGDARKRGWLAIWMSVSLLSVSLLLWWS